MITSFIWREVRRGQAFGAPPPLIQQSGIFEKLARLASVARPYDAIAHQRGAKMRKVLLAMGALALAGCASTSDIDLSKVDSKCGQTCSANYSDCLGKFTLFPIQAQHQCTDAMRLCAQSCPARQPS